MSKALASLKTLAALTMGINAYSDAGEAKKNTLHRTGKAFLRVLADDLGLVKGEFDIRSNLGGIAVSGEVTLHGEAIYVQLSESCIGQGGVSVLFRDCKGRKDCCGGRNHFISIASLSGDAYPAFVEQCKRLIESATAAA